MSSKAVAAQTPPLTCDRPGSVAKCHCRTSLFPETFLAPRFKPALWFWKDADWPSNFEKNPRCRLHSPPNHRHSKSAAMIERALVEATALSALAESSCVRSCSLTSPLPLPDRKKLVAQAWKLNSVPPEREYRSVKPSVEATLSSVKRPMVAAIGQPQFFPEKRGTVINPMKPATQIPAAIFIGVLRMRRRTDEARGLSESDSKTLIRRASETFRGSGPNGPAQPLPVA
jgi:hypothetical protein